MRVAFSTKHNPGEEFAKLFFEYKRCPATT